ncbi:MAG: hypothetical protein RIR97_435 [Pseudomonadota bacterium]
MALRCREIETDPSANRLKYKSCRMGVRQDVNLVIRHVSAAVKAQTYLNSDRMFWLSELAIDRA